jgi:NO-binding membrane sensor protein with MHYT domain
MKHAVPFILAILLGAIAGYVDLQEEEVQMPALLIISFAFFLGFARPRTAWAWGLVIGLSIPAAHLIARMIGYKPPYPVSLPTTFLPVAFALAGAYAGVAMKKLILRRTDT